MNNNVSSTHAAKHTKSLRAGIAIVAGITSAMAVIVIAGWHLSIPKVVQLHPTFVPMQYNTALGFFALGAGLMAHLSGRLRIRPVFAALLFLIGTLTLVEYVFGVDLRIDELFMRHDIVVQTSHPGRMAPNTALCFSLSGMAILLLGVRTESSYAKFALQALGASVTALGLVALGGYVFHFEAAYGWGALTCMAAHTAFGFIIGGLGITCGAVEFDTDHGHRLARNLTLPIGFFGFVVSILLWQGLAESDIDNTRRLAEAKAIGQTDSIKINIERHHEVLTRMVNRWQQRGGTPYEDWQIDAEAYVRDIQSLQALEWVDKTNRVRWIVPLEGNEQAQGLDLTKEPIRRAALEFAFNQRAAKATESITLVQGGTGFLVFYPLFVDSEFDGFLLAVFRHDKLFKPLLQRTVQNGWNVTLSDREQTLYTSDNQKSAQVLAASTIETRFGTWQLYMSPTPDTLENLRSPFPRVILVVGLIISVLLGLSWFLLWRATGVQNALRSSNTKLEKSERILAHKLAEVERAEQKLIQANDELGRRNRELEEFSYIASHDLQEPLRKLITFSSLLKNDIGGDLPENARKDLHFIRTSAQQMQNLVQALLALSRATKNEMRLEQFAMKKSVDQAIEALEISINETQAEITCDPLPDVLGDSALLTQLFQNLIGNAVKFRNKDDSPHIQITCEKVNKEYTIGVKDDGIGIKPEYAERVFAPFKRLHSREVYEGTGIGLAICRKVVERHGGVIWVESEFGAGAHFKFTLGNATLMQPVAGQRVSEAIKT